jgi:hypothetical protein
MATVTHGQNPMPHFARAACGSLRGSATIPALVKPTQEPVGVPGLRELFGESKRNPIQKSGGTPQVHVTRAEGITIVTPHCAPESQERASVLQAFSRSSTREAGVGWTPTLHQA